MQNAARHYYRAVVWHYLADDPRRALAELYLTLQQLPDHAPAAQLARRIGWKASKDLPATNKTTALGEADIASLLALLDRGENDLFLLDFLSREEVSEPVLRQIEWDDWLREIGDFSKNTDRIWYCLLHHNLGLAFDFWQQSCRDIRGAPVAYFQIAYMLKQRQQWAEAETYLQLLAEFGGTYRQAAVRMALQLGKHSFASTAEFLPFATLTDDELLRLAHIVQNSWDTQTLARLLEILPARLHDAGQLLPFAILALAEGKSKLAVRALRRAVAGKAYQEVLDCLRHTSWQPTDPHLRRLLKSLAHKLQGRQLCHLATLLQERAPQLAGRIFHRAGQQLGNPGLVYLGKAICYFHMAVAAQATWLAYRSRKYFFQFCDLLSKADVRDAALKPNIMAWQGRLMYQQGQYDKCSGFLSQALAQFPTSVELQEAMRQVAVCTCPVCAAPMGAVEACKACGHKPLHLFAWEYEKLHWQGGKSSPPLAWSMVTSDALVYASDHQVCLLWWTPYAGEGHVAFCQNGAPVRERTVTLRAGINVWRENPFFGGMYEVRATPPVGIANRHWFLVGKKGAGLAVRQEVGSNETAGVRLRWTDALGLPLRGKTRVDTLSPAGDELVAETTREIAGGVDSCALAWPKGEWSDLAADGCWPKWVRAQSENGEQLATAVVGLSPLSPAAYVAAVLAYWRSRYAHLPVTMEQNGGRFACKFTRPQQQSVLVLQPLADKAPLIARGESIDKGESLCCQLPSMFNLFYLGTTRFYPGHACQDTGMEIGGVLANPALVCHLETPQRVAPGEAIGITVRVSRPAQIVLLSSAAGEDTYLPLTAHALRLIAGGLPAFATVTTGDQRATMWQQDDWRLTRVDGSAGLLHMQEVTVAGEMTLSLPSRLDIGRQRLVCVASDGDFVAEETACVEVAPPAYARADIPAAILPGDCLQARLEFHAVQAARLQVRSWSGGMWHDREVRGSGSLPLTIASADTIEVKVGEWEKRYDIRPLTMYARNYQHFHCLVAGMHWDGGKLLLYPHTLALAEETVQALARDAHGDFETLSARLYGAGKLYQQALQVRDEARMMFWEKEIAEITPRFCGMVDGCPIGRLGYWPGEPEDTRVSAAVLHHLSPFAAMPRFASLHALANKMLRAALAARYRDSRLFFLSLEFRERGFSSPEAAASALLYGFEVEKALRYLQKNARYDAQHVCWHGKSLGGVEETTAVVGRALYARKFPLWQQAMTFLGGRFRDGMLANTSATVAWLEWLWDMEPTAGKLVSANGETLALPHKNECTTSFSVVQGEIWGCQERQSWEDVIGERASAVLKLSWHGKQPVHVGDEFRISLRIKGVRYPSLRVLVAANAVLQKDQQTYQGNLLWPLTSRSPVLCGRAIRVGTAHFCFILEDRYQKGKQWVGKCPLVVE